MFLTRDKATGFIREQGIPASDRMLADFASRGIGPRYAVIAGRAVYRPADLVAWIDEVAAQEPKRRRA